MVPVLDPALHNNCCEGLCGHVEVAKHNIVSPPPHEYNCVGVNSFQ